MTTTNQREYHSYLEVQVKMKKATGPRKSPLLCIYQLQEALESFGEDVGVGVSLCVVYVWERSYIYIVVVHNT
jgi:hypothetical protein